MKLYGSLTSPFVRHCRMVAMETNADVEFIEIDASISAVKSPTKRMPFLEDGELFLSDSSAIVRYLRERAGQSFCSSVIELDQLCLVNTLLEVTTNLFFLQRDGITGEGSPYIERQKARLESILEIINGFELPTQAPYSDVQLRLASYMGWSLLRNMQSFDKYPNIKIFYQGIQSYPPFAQTQPPTT